MKKDFLIKTRRDFVRIAGSGFYSRSASIIVQCIANEASKFRVGFTASRKVGNAVVRNRCKRRMRMAARSVLIMDGNGLSGVDYVFIARRSTANSVWDNLLTEIRNSVLFLNKKILKCKKLQSR